MFFSANKVNATQRDARKIGGEPAGGTNSQSSPGHRSTAEQRQAFIEHLYSDYSELHAQQSEIHDRKNQMDFDMFDSNQQEIHELLFANVEATNGALGDWDTWEKVEALMKRYAYGRPRHTAQEREEDAALRSRIDALSEVVSERNATIQELTHTCTAAQQEIGGLLKLLHGKNNDIKTLSNQLHMTSLQLRYVQRECAALRGLRNENETSLLKQDLSYLIEANKKLESENQLLRGRQLVTEGVLQQSVSTASGTHPLPSAEPPAERNTTFSPLQAPPTSVDADALDRCLTDDAFRREFLHKEVPLSGAVVSAKHETAHWKRRLEAEVNRAMEMLDHDAAQAELPSSSLHAFARRDRPEGVTQLQNGVFISYASYESAPRHRPEQSAVPVLTAPATVSAAPAHVFSTAPAAPVAARSSQDVVATTTPLAPAGVKSEAAPPATSAAATRSSASPDTRKSRRVSHSLPGRTAAAAAGTATATASPPARKSTHSVVRTRQSASEALAIPFATLRSAVLQCAELSRANAMRRELLHVAYLRQQMVDEVARRSSSPAEQSAAGDERMRPESAESDERRGRSEEDSVAARTTAADSLKSDSLSSAEPAGSTAPQRLRQRVKETRSPSQDAEGGTPDGGDGGEVQSSVVFAASEDGAGGRVRSDRKGEAKTPRDSRAASLRTPTPPPPPPPPLSSPHGSRLQSSVQGEAHGDVRSAPAQALLLAPLRQRTSMMREEVAALRESVVVYWAELQDALALLGGVFAEQESRVTQAVEMKAEERAMEGAAERVLEEAALLRTAQILKERFGSLLPADAFTAATLPETATDEEWLVNQLHSAAAGMIRGSVNSHADGAVAGASAVPHSSVRGDQASPTPPTSSTPVPPVRPSQARRPTHATEHDFFEAEILRPFRLHPNFGNGGPSHRTMQLLNGDVVWTDETDDGDGTDGAQRAGGRAVGGVDGRARNRPAPPPSWNWRTRNVHNFGSTPRDGAAEPRAALPARHPVTFTAASLASAVASPHQPSPESAASVQSIKPTVLRYVFNSSKAATPRAVSEHMHQKTAFLYGSEFEGFVQEYIVPVISAASRFAAGGKMNPSLRAAVQDLRQKERIRRKRGVRLLFDRVVNNIRTRNLLQRNVFQGQAFASYVGVLYGNWRAKLEGDRRRVRSAEETNRNALFSLLQLQNSASPDDTFTKPAPPPVHPPGKTKPAGGGPKRAVNSLLSKSSFHFEKAKFGGH